MSININHVKSCLSSFDLKKLLVEELNWGNCNLPPVEIKVEGQPYRLIPLAQQAGMVVYQGEHLLGGEMPPPPVRRAIENRITKQTHEHIIIFTNKEKSQAIWQWVKREQGQSPATREIPYYKGQTGEPLLQKLSGIAFSINDLDEEGKAAITTVTHKVASSFDVEKVTKRFYVEFKSKHDEFARLIQGLKNQEDIDWYVSVMLNRLMFIYFIQKKGFLNRDQDYLKHKLEESKKKGKDLYYEEFLIPLFFEGFAREKKMRLAGMRQLLGDIPYLNGGIFQKHKLEEENPDITIPDIAFERIFAFFDCYQWHLDYNHKTKDNEINPDVLGYIFEQYINRKQMGAYYTKEDITGYICKNTIIPALLEKLDNLPLIKPQLFPIKDIEPYIYPAVKQKEYLPTETEREYKARQTRYEQIKADFASGKINSINDLITYNLDILQYVQDWADNIEDPRVLQAFYFECLNKITILDPTVGSGAFLFAALNILEPLYETCIYKMVQLGGPEFPKFREEFKRVAQHPNLKYFILKSVVINNLFGVDIMEEAVEICKLRLFLKLVAQIDDVNKIEPLPDIDFNIRAGNTLVGYANLEEIRGSGHLDLSGSMRTIEEKIAAADRDLKNFRDLQTTINVPAFEIIKAKQGVINSLKAIQNVLDKDLASFYGNSDMQQFKKTHQPFHWIVEFYSIIKNNGFDVIIGNPPYVNISKIDYSIHPVVFKCIDCKDLFALTIERAYALIKTYGRIGVIVPLSTTSTDTMIPLKMLISNSSLNIWTSYYSASDQPSSLFSGVRHRLLILLTQQGQTGFSNKYSTNFIKWFTDERPYLFQSFIHYVDISELNDFCKVSSSCELSILKKMSRFDKVSKYITNRGIRIYYHNAPVHWGKVFDFIPYYKVGNNPPDKSSHVKEIFASNELYASVIICLLNSSLFYWFNWLYSNCRDLSLKDIYRVPIGINVMDNSTKMIFGNLKNILMHDYKKNSKMYRRISNNISTEFASFYPMYSKAIINKIDNALAQHYGFTEEELDFILNYDIKYRMGKDNMDNNEADSI